MVALNKSSGLLVAADRWDPDAPRLDILATQSLCAEGERLYAVHRIDKDTSGLVVYAKSPSAPNGTEGQTSAVPPELALCAHSIA